jgi:hypothetical protein
MLCGICNTINSKFSVKCKNCGAFLQNPVRVLNLFETIGMIIFNPTEGFHRIVLSESKNFSVFLTFLFGIAITFDLFYLAEAGEEVDNLALLIFYVTAFGILLGIIISTVISLVIKFLLLFSEEKISLKSIFAVFAYSVFPIAFSVFFLLPALLSVFGIYYFTESPKPETLKPIPFYILSVVNLSLKIYSFTLLSIALKHITGNFLKGLIFTFISSICVLILLNLLARALKVIL